MTAMDKDLARIYVCPATHEALQLDASSADGDEVLEGTLQAAGGARYAIRDGLPDFTHPERLPEVEATTRADYDAVADQIYDNAVDWQFAAMRADENEVREQMVDWLGLEPGSKVLEIGAGTGRDSFRIARRLSAAGELFLQDLSPRMVAKCRATMAAKSAELDLAVPQRYFISTAQYLPFADGYLDAVFHFGGFNHFADQKAGFAEMARVTRTGGKIVCGDEAVAPWLRDTEYAAVLITNNPLFAHEAPLHTLPPGARDVCVHWILGNCFYVVELRVGEGLPDIDMDLPHAGSRGGTLRTRYYGQLEGVTTETKELALAAARKSGSSMHEWLDEVVRTRAQEELEEDPDG